MAPTKLVDAEDSDEDEQEKEQPQQWRAAAQVSILQQSLLSIMYYTNVCLLQGGGKAAKPKYVYKTVDELKVHVHVMFRN